MSACGTKRTFQDVCYLVAIGDKADIFCSLRPFPLLTRLRHLSAPANGEQVVIVPLPPD
jgi:hypothetical protein